MQVCTYHGGGVSVSVSMCLCLCVGQETTFGNSCSFPPPLWVPVAGRRSADFHASAFTHRASALSPEVVWFTFMHWQNNSHSSSTLQLFIHCPRKTILSIQKAFLSFSKIEARILQIHELFEPLESMSYSNFDSKEPTVPHEGENEEEKEAKRDSHPKEWTKEDGGKRAITVVMCFQTEGDNWEALMFFAWEIKIHHSITSRNFRELKIKVLNIPEGF